MVFFVYELYIVERFDRKIFPERVARIHQEDFCQAMGVPVHKKYYAEGDPRFGEYGPLLMNILIRVPISELKWSPFLSLLF